MVCVGRVCDVTDMCVDVQACVIFHISPYEHLSCMYDRADRASTILDSITLCRNVYGGRGGRGGGGGERGGGG